MKIFVHVLLLTAILAFQPMVVANTPGSSSTPTGTTTGKAPPPPPVKKVEPTKPGYHQQAKPPAPPPMTKEFDMPGVVGLQNGRWEGTDYLGFLDSNIGLDIEVLKGENAVALPDNAVLLDIVSKAFVAGGLNPHAIVAEGPPLPFLHFLLIVYPVEKDRYVIFGSCRLFEEIEVVRKNFNPAGYWQAITWESQDVVWTRGDQLDEKLKALMDKLSKLFVERYRTYNPNPEKPGAAAGEGQPAKIK